MVCATENYIAMKIPELGSGGGVLIGSKGSEPARTVGFVGGLDCIEPRRFTDTVNNVTVEASIKQASDDVIAKIVEDMISFDKIEQPTID